jgi:hypothetical protein
MAGFDGANTRAKAMMIAEGLEPQSLYFSLMKCGWK